jgi:hypothetical protein
MGPGFPFVGLSSYSHARHATGRAPESSHRTPGPAAAARAQQFEVPRSRGRQSSAGPMTTGSRTASSRCGKAYLRAKWRRPTLRTSHGLGRQATVPMAVTRQRDFVPRASSSASSAAKTGTDPGPNPWRFWTRTASKSRSYRPSRQALAGAAATASMILAWRPAAQAGSIDQGLHSDAGGRARPVLFRSEACAHRHHRRKAMRASCAHAASGRGTRDESRGMSRANLLVCLRVLASNVPEPLEPPTRKGLVAASHIFRRRVGLVCATLSPPRKIAEPDHCYYAQYAETRNSDNSRQYPASPARRPDHFVAIVDCSVRHD